MTDRTKPGSAALARNFSQLSQVEKTPSMEMGINITHLLHAQKYNRALILEGLEASEKFAQDEELHVVLMSAGGQGIGGEAIKVYGKAAGNLTLEELALVNYPGTLSDFLKETGYRVDTPVSYVVLNPKRHAILAVDGEGNMSVVRRNESFQPRFH